MADRPITPGKWGVHGQDSCDIHVDGLLDLKIATVDGIGWQEAIANARLIALAGTTANRIYDLGYDAERVFERLPRLLADCRSIADYIETQPLPMKHGDLEDEIRTLGRLLTTLTQGGE